ncbi:hypothetical protein LRC537489_51020 [Mycobacterium riyadhense]
MHMVHAEKIATAVQRGPANTRWRDFADVWTLANRHPVNGSDLQKAVHEVALHRHAQLLPLQDLLDGFADVAQPKWAAWRRRNGYDHLPELFQTVLGEVIDFAQPALFGETTGQRWNPGKKHWGSVIDDR